jgi:adenylyltransferase/sulfurtransferase
VLECTDQPALKFATNDACLAAGVPLVVGAALGWTGQAMAVMAGHACYRCIYESPPPPDTLPTCDAAGVIGPAVGHVGAVMAALALQLAAGTPATAGRLLAIDSRDGRTSALAPRPRASCSACRATPTLAEAAAPV